MTILDEMKVLHSAWVRCSIEPNNIVDFFSKKGYDLLQLTKGGMKVKNRKTQYSYTCIK